MSNFSERCSFLHFTDGVGLCTKLDCVCRCFLCEHSKKCDWIEECCASDWEIVEDVRSSLLTASRKIKNIIQNKKRYIPEEEFIGGLLRRREEAILRGFTFTPGDFSGAVLMQRYLKTVPSLSESDIKLTDRMIELTNLIIFRDQFDQDRKKIENGDLKIFANSDGLSIIEKMADKPIDYMNHITERMKNIQENKTDLEFDEHSSLLYLWTKKMVKPIRWSLDNNMPVDIIRLDHTKQVIIIMNHMEQIGMLAEEGKQIVLDKRVCFEHSYDIYKSNIAVIGSLYKQSPELRNAISSLEDNHTNLTLAFKRKIDVETWENFVMNAYFRGYYENYLFEHKEIENDSWQLGINDGAFWASTLLLSFIQTNNAEIVSNLERKGWTFEEMLRTDFIDRDVEIIQKNYPTPHGDIDFICKKNSRYYVIEVKDYAPWYRDCYMSSKYHEKRSMTLNRMNNVFIKRVDWLNSNLSTLNLSQSPEPMFISIYKEEDLINNLRYSDLDNVFGKSKYPKLSELLPEFILSNKQITARIGGKEILNSDTPEPEENTNSITFRECEKHPKCIGIFIEDNKWLLEEGNILEIYKNMTNARIGGPCPEFEAFCMWADFCRMGIDPTPYAKKLETEKRPLDNEDT